MVITQIEELLTKIQQLQSIMIAVATDAYRNPIRDKEKSYTKLYKDIVYLREFLEEEGVIIENHNPFKSLLDWRDRWSSLERGYASKGKYVHDLYNTSLNQIDIVLCQHHIKGKSHQQLVEEWQISKFEDLIVQIKKLKGIMISVAIQRDTIDLINYEDKDYRKLYRELILQISILRQISIPVPHSNNFRSLWQWYHYWSFNLDKSYDVRETYINDLYENILNQIERALKKYHLQSTSTEEFIQDLQRRFKQQISVQPSTPAILSTEVSGTLQEFTPNLEDYLQPEALEQISDLLPIGVTQAVDNSFVTTINSTVNWTHESVMNPEIFLDQQDITPLIMALNNFALKLSVASDRQNFLENTGVDFAFLSNLRFDTSPNIFAQSLVSAFKNYQISHQNLNHHPLVNVLKSLCELESIYGLKYQDVELFTRLVEKGQENLKALAARNTVGRIESPIGNPIGTGVLITNDLLLTCNHIFSKSQVQKAWVRFGYKAGKYESEKDILELNIIPNNSRFDYALLKINPQTQQKAISIDETSILDSGQNIRIIHHPQGNPVIISDFGQITQVGEDYIDHNVKTDDGSSGAPIFNRQWELIAIHQGNPGIGRTVNRGSTGGIPIRAIWTQISPYLG
ncbi:trypsin-like peptidase domain-containing protein [Nostoc sp. ATCC 53789]|uniref:trypsin-like peptidase domain-containing protein n=1 Tax=Nostoc sp. ATCC 53789 TaxID=76335 RepID=UPI001ADB0BCB|nr:trypsin-like peptidase domain-containing protein [Nostoc sp. ATCC 53789]